MQAGPISRSTEPELDRVPFGPHFGEPDEPELNLLFSAF